MSATVDLSLHATDEERFKIWAFKKSLSGLRTMPSEHKQAIAAMVTPAKSTPVEDSNAATEEGDAMNRIVNFLQLATSQVAGRNMDALSAQSLFVFGVMCGLDSCIAALQAALPPTVIDDGNNSAQVSQQENIEPSPASTTGKPSAGVAVKKPSKPKLLLALSALRYEDEPVAARSHAPPKDMDFEHKLIIQQQLRKERPGRTSTASSSAPVEKAHRSEVRSRQPAAAVAAATASPPSRVSSGVRLVVTHHTSNVHGPLQASVPTIAQPIANDDDSSTLEISGPSTDRLRIRRQAESASFTTTSPTAAPPELESTVARIIHALSVCTVPTIVEKLRQQSFDVNEASVRAVVDLLVQRENVVIERGIVYPLM